MNENYGRGVIYCLCVNDYIIYIGKSFGKNRIRDRPKEHVRLLKNNKHPNKILQSLYNTYGVNKIRYRILKSYDEISNEELSEKEIHYIAKYSTYTSGANLTIGGDTVTGMKHSDETKLKLSNRIKGENNHFYGKKHTEETKIKLSKAGKGKVINEKQMKGLATQWKKGVPKSEEHRKNISIGLKGRKYSDETIKKMSEAKKGKKWTEESKNKRLATIRKLSPNEVVKVFVLANFTNKTNVELGKEFDVGIATISKIKNIGSEYIKKDILENYSEVIKLVNKILKFEKTGCNPCVRVQNLLDEKGVSVDKIDAFSNPELSSQYDIGSLPTLILLDEEDNELQRTVGFNPIEIESMIEKFNQ